MAPVVTMLINNPLTGMILIFTGNLTGRFLLRVSGESALRAHLERQRA